MSLQPAPSGHGYPTHGNYPNQNLNLQLQHEINELKTTISDFKQVVTQLLDFMEAESLRNRKENNKLKFPESIITLLRKLGFNNQNHFKDFDDVELDCDVDGKNSDENWGNDNDNYGGGSDDDEIDGSDNEIAAETRVGAEESESSIITIEPIAIQEHDQVLGDSDNENEAVAKFRATDTQESAGVNADAKDKAEVQSQWFQNYLDTLDPEARFAQLKILDPESYDKDKNKAGEKPSKPKRLVICPICQKSFCKASYLTYHISRVHRSEENDEPPTYSHTCPTCGKGFFQLSCMKHHQISHLGPNDLELDPNLLKLFTCPTPKCSKEFKSKKYLHMHMKWCQKPETEKSFRCDWDGCTKSYRRYQDLKVHQRIHNGLKPFVCKVFGCTEGFMRSRNLKIHVLRAHLGVDKKSQPKKSYAAQAYIHQCEICYKKFNRIQSLKSHMRNSRSHNPIPNNPSNSNNQICENYECEFCGRHYKSSAGLVKHKNKVHGGN